ncbi:DUF11 domain-containing protein [Thalassoroseus pseudoceratinae]|uniref:DUF11 domain-containing protein n=1 Tax=Thalassoroseus pseudoceratinae TaxID=2713176 RepID=UPI00141DCFF2|nr:DUF11 domain-containing protein [Thalassoroseus pseudoceratinae]
MQRATWIGLGLTTAVACLVATAFSWASAAEPASEIPVSNPFAPATGPGITVPQNQALPVSSPSEEVENPFAAFPATPPQKPVDRTPALPQPRGTLTFGNSKPRTAAPTPQTTLQPIPEANTTPIDFAAKKPDFPEPVPQPNFPANAPVSASTNTTFPEFSIQPGYAAKPDSGAASSAVMLKWKKVSEINVGQACHMELMVQNNGQHPAHDVTVQGYFADSVRFLKETSPAPVVKPSNLVWMLGSLQPGDVRKIDIRFVPTKRGELAASAFVRYTSGVATTMNVAEPLLEVALTGPSEVQLGDPASQIIAVTNPGTGIAQNVDIKALIPPGLEHPAGKQLEMNIGSLNPGETRQVRLALAAIKGGEHSVQVIAEARQSNGGETYLRKVTQSSVRVISPSVKIAMNGPGLRYKGRDAVYRIQVTNDGTAVSNNVRVLHKLPAGFEFVNAENGGKYDASSRSIGWFIGQLGAGQTATVTTTLKASALGEQEHLVSALTDQGTRAQSKFQTKVDGVAALVLEVSDQYDPVEVGADTYYEVVIRNEGTKAAANVMLACQLPNGVQLTNTDGPTQASKASDVVRFQPLPTLAPGKTVTFRVGVKGQKDGYQRIRAQLVSDSIPEPLTVEELTRFYGE